MLGIDGKGVETFKKPDVEENYAIKTPATSDEFNLPKLGLQWQWNHNPDDDKWSLTEYKGEEIAKTFYIRHLLLKIFNLNPEK